MIHLYWHDSLSSAVTNNSERENVWSFQYKKSLSKTSEDALSIKDDIINVTIASNGTTFHFHRAAAVAEAH